jgi:hypothetical protein
MKCNLSFIPWQRQGLALESHIRSCGLSAKGKRALSHFIWTPRIRYNLKLDGVFSCLNAYNMSLCKFSERMSPEGILRYGYQAGNPDLWKPEEWRLASA